MVSTRCPAASGTQAVLKSMCSHHKELQLIRFRLHCPRSAPACCCALACSCRLRLRCPQLQPACAAVAAPDFLPLLFRSNVMSSGTLGAAIEGSLAGNHIPHGFFELKPHGPPPGLSTPQLVTEAVVQEHERPWLLAVLQDARVLLSRFPSRAGTLGQTQTSSRQFRCRACSLACTSLCWQAAGCTPLY